MSKTQIAFLVTREKYYTSCQLYGASLEDIKRHDWVVLEIAQTIPLAADCDVLRIGWELLEESLIAGEPAIPYNSIEWSEELLYRMQYLFFGWGGAICFEKATKTVPDFACELWQCQDWESKLRE